jgi:hypothetical protein
MQRLPGDAEQLGDSSGHPPERWQDIVAEEFAEMHRRQAVPDRLIGDQC